MKKINGVENCWTLEIKCTGSEHGNQIPCSQMWEINENDIVVRTKWDWDNEIEIFGFICPDCGTFTQVERLRDIPEDIRNRCLIKFRNAQAEAKKVKKGNSIWNRIFKRIAVES